LNVFGTTGAIGTARSGVSTALAELNRNRLARGTAPAATRPNAKSLRVESPPMKSTPQGGCNRGRMRRLADAVWAQAWFKLVHSGGIDRTIGCRELLPGPPPMSAMCQKRTSEPARAYHLRRSNSGSLAILAAIGRASSFVSNLDSMSALKMAVSGPGAMHRSDRYK